MRRVFLLFPMMLGLSILTGCERIVSPPEMGEPIDFHYVTEDIPVSYGRFVAAIRHTETMATLWFEQDDRTIVGVRVNVSTGRPSREVIQLRRTQ